MQRESRWCWPALLAGIAMLVICCEKPTSLYYNDSPAFTVEYPKEWNVPRELFMGDVMSVAGPDRYTSLKINISFRSAYDTLADAPRTCVTALQKMYPESSRHKVQLKKMILLQDGTRALYVFVSCKLDNERIFLVSSNVIAFKGNRTVMVICTTLARKPYDVLQDVTHSLRFTKVKVKPPVKPKVIRIAIMDFIPKGIPASLALDISEMIRAEMKKNRDYVVIERSQMNELLKRFQQIECTNVACAIKVARLLTVQKIVIGSASQLGATIAISGSMVDAEKGTEERSATHVAYSRRDLSNAVTHFIRKLRGF